MGLPLNSTQRLITILTVASLLTISTVNIVLSSVSWSTLHVDMAPFNDLLLNWNQGTILNIRSAATCPNGYSPAITQTWPGTTTTCYCGNANAVLMNKFSITCNSFCSGACSNNALTAGCTNVLGGDPKVLDHYGSVGSTNEKLCIMRSNETFVSNAALSVGDCPSGYRQCGNSAETKFCTRLSICPIVGVRVSFTTSTTIGTNCATDPDNYNCTVLAYDGTNYRILSWFRSDVVDMLPISQFRVNEFGMCFLSTIDNVTPGRQQYFPLAKKPTTCNNVGDSQWAAFDSRLESYVFSVNSLSSTISGYDNYPSPGMSGYYPTGMTGDNYRYKTYQRSYIPWNATSRDQFTKLVNNVNRVKVAEQTQTGYFAMSIIGFFFLGIFLTFLELINLFDINVQFIKYLKGTNSPKARKFRMFIKYFFKIAQIPLQLSALGVAVIIRNFFRHLGEIQPSVTLVNTEFANFPNVYYRAYWSTVATFALTTASIVFDIVLDVYASKHANDNKQPTNIRSKAPVDQIPESPDALRSATQVEMTSA